MKFKPEMPSKDETVEAIAEIGRRQRERERLQADMNDQIALIKQEFERLSDPHNQVIKQASLVVHLYCSTNRNELTQGGKTKTATLISGEVKWRTTPPKVTIRNSEQVIATLKKLGMSNLVRISEEINKEAILADPKAVEGIKGVAVTQREDFIIIPFETKLEEVA